MSYRYRKFETDAGFFKEFRRQLALAVASGERIGLVHGRITKHDLKQMLNSVKVFNPEIEIIYYNVVENDTVFIVELEAP